jgi:hypothetical protein
MAIRRCPYCTAIIDEQDKYCNNCGTQLLFPEDEFVEEEIPGDKLLDKEEPEEAEDKDTGEEQELEAELEEEEELVEDEDDEEEEEGEPGDYRLEDEEDEEKDMDKLEELEGPEEIKTKPRTSGEEAGRAEDDGERRDADREEDEEEVEEDEDEFGSPDLAGTGQPVEPHEVAEKKYEISIEEDDLVIKTREVARLAGMADEGATVKKPIPDTGSLPPWASRIRQTPAAVGPEEGTQSPAALSREWTTDSGIGIPEKITQAALPFGDTASQGGRTPSQEINHVEEKTHDATAEEAEPGLPGGLSLKLRAKLVDWVFVTALWVISLWFTAQVVGVSFFRLLFGSPLPVLAFYVILLVLYFFLFLYFLGETLGDHYFSE